VVVITAAGLFFLAAVFADELNSFLRPKSSRRRHFRRVFLRLLSLAGCADMLISAAANKGWWNLRMAPFHALVWFFALAGVFVVFAIVKVVRNIMWSKKT
jgi:hypothetical protein